MRAITVLTVWLFLPLTAVAQNVAVLPVSYKIYRTNSLDEERAAKVKEAVVQGVMNAGLTPMTGEDIDRESRAYAPLGDTYCITSDCPLKVAERVQADLGVAVSVSDHDGQFDIHIYTTYAEPITASPFGTFNSIRKRITAMVRDALAEALSNQPKAAAPVETEKREDEYVPPPDMSGQMQDDEVVDDKGEKSPPGPDLQGRKKPIKRPVFWSVFGVTAAVGLGCAGIEILGYVATKTVDDPPQKTLDSWDVERLTNKILFGVAATGIVTTTILAFFTDFKGTYKVEKKEEEEELNEEEIFNNLDGRGGKRDSSKSEEGKVGGFSRVRLAPVIGAGLGGLVIEGAF